MLGWRRLDINWHSCRYLRTISATPSFSTSMRVSCSLLRDACRLPMQRHTMHLNDSSPSVRDSPPPLTHKSQFPCRTFPVGVTPGSTNCWSWWLFLKALPMSPLLKKAMSSSIYTGLFFMSGSESCDLVDIHSLWSPLWISFIRPHIMVGIRGISIE